MCKEFAGPIQSYIICVQLAALSLSPLTHPAFPGPSLLLSTPTKTCCTSRAFSLTLHAIQSFLFSDRDLTNSLLFFRSQIKRPSSKVTSNHPTYHFWKSLSISLLCNICFLLYLPPKVVLLNDLPTSLLIYYLFLLLKYKFYENRNLLCLFHHHISCAWSMTLDKYLIMM